MDFFFSGIKLSSSTPLEPLLHFTKELPYSREITLLFVDKQSVPQYDCLFQTVEIACYRTTGGKLYRAVKPPAVSLFMAEDYNTMTACYPLDANEHVCSVKLMHLIRTALECVLPYHGGVSLHAACVVFDEKAVAFTAPSGTGKSTRANQWVSRLGAKMISGDRPVIRLTDDGAVACGIPWDGKEQIFTQTEADLLAILEVRRAPFQRLRKLSKKQARNLLVRQCLMPMWDESAVHVVMRVIMGIIDSVPIYRIFGGMDENLAVFTHHALFSPMGKNEIREVASDMKIKGEFMVRNIMDEHIVMPINESIGSFGGAIVLNEVSEFIWNHMKESITKEDLLDLILGEFDVDRETASQDLENFLNKMREIGVLEEENP